MFIELNYVSRIFFYINFLQSQYSVKGRTKFQSLSLITFTGTGHMANSSTIKLVLSSFLVPTHSSLCPGKDQRPCYPPPQTGTPATLFVNHETAMWVPQWVQTCAWCQARPRNGQGTGIGTGFPSAFSHLRESWRWMMVMRDMACQWGGRDFGPSKVRHS